MYLAVGILRVQEGLDYTGVIEEEDQVTPQQLLLELKKEKEKGIVRNQSESQLSHGKQNCFYAQYNLYVSIYFKANKMPLMMYMNVLLLYKKIIV